MQLCFFGANQQVTGSRHFVAQNGGGFFVDYGMFQERPFLDRNWEPSPVPWRQIQSILLTHSHLDHCGLLPRLYKEGFCGPIYMTPATAALAEIILRDSAHIQVEDALFKRKRHQKEGRRGKHPEIPLYTVEDVERVLPQFRPVEYDEPFEPAKGCQAVFRNAGHILGSAIVELEIHSNARSVHITFSGDLGQYDMPILCDPYPIRQTDHLVMESTYGGRLHEGRDTIPEQLERIIKQTVARGGNVVIPAFAVERSQEVLYHLGLLLEAGRIPPVPVFLDSPMAIDVTEVFRRFPECFDANTWKKIQAGEPPFRFPGLRLTRSVEESKAINDLTEPAIIMASSGMCTAGRIKHHLRHNITRPESTILFVGYQVRGTLGRQILDRNPEVRIHGRMWPVRAHIEQVHGFSGHADREGLMRWLSNFQQPPKQVFLVHGEPESSAELARRIQEQLGWTTIIPEYTACWHLG